MIVYAMTLIVSCFFGDSFSAIRQLTIWVEERRQAGKRLC
jgi:hypothetical protein